MKCVTDAWDLYEDELRAFLYKQTKDLSLADDLLQDVFVKALSENSKFCTLDNSRAWLYRVTKNRLIDYHRTHKAHDEVPDNLAEDKLKSEPVVKLSKCLPSALNNLSDEDREVIQLCDLDGMNQADYAKFKNLSTAGAKSRIQRARRRLKEELNIACKIVFDEQGKVCCFDPSCK